MEVTEVTGVTEVTEGEGTEVIRVEKGDLVATARASVTLAQLDAALVTHEAWVALDAPGSRERALGDVLAEGAAGPLAAGFGAPRDQVLGLSFVAGTGTAVKTGGRVVKNVAGFDLAKLLIGSHGAFGRITEAHLRLRVRPAADASGVMTGSRAVIAGHSLRLMTGGANPAAFEVISPPLAAAMGIGEDWALLLRAMGSRIAVEEELGACRAAPAPVRWDRWDDAVASWPVRLRIGCDPAGWNEVAAAAFDALGDTLGLSVCVPRGFLRLGLSRASAATVTRLRAALPGHPVTIERGDDSAMTGAGIWGSLDAGALAVTRRLLAVYDPDGSSRVPLFAT